MEQNGNRFAPEAPADESASLPQPQPAQDAAPDFDPVPLRYRRDGLTPDKQREYVEALADCGVAKEAAARIGISEQAVNRARRRPDARSFDLACEAAMRHVARRIRSIAFERAIQGTVKRHYYHGELKSEEVVYDNKLLIYLLGKTERYLDTPEESEAVADHWEEWMEAMEQGLPAPELPVESDELEEDEEEAVDPEAPRGDEIWKKDGVWWTNFPPPAGFEGEEQESPRSIFYCRTLSDAERAAAEADEARAWADRLALETTRRDRRFGFKGGVADRDWPEPPEDLDILRSGNLKL